MKDDDEQSPAEPGGKPSGGSGNGNPTCKRFSFYNAEEVQNTISPPAPPEKNNRFNFYNKEEVNAKSREAAQIDVVKALQSKRAPPRPTPPHRAPEQRQPSVTMTNKKNIKNLNKKINKEIPNSYSESPTAHQPSSAQQQQQHPSDIDSTEILRSLQETEREHWRLHRSSHNNNSHNNSHKTDSTSKGGKDDGQESSSDESEGSEEDDVADDDTPRQDNVAGEQQQPSCSSRTNGRRPPQKNPYEDAIKEAILMLRRNRPTSQDHHHSHHDDHTGLTVDLAMQSPSSSHKKDNNDTPVEFSRSLHHSSTKPDGNDVDVVDSIEDMRLSTSPSDVREDERKIQQERMAKYASKLVEDLGGVSSGESHDVAESTLSLPAVTVDSASKSTLQIATAAEDTEHSSPEDDSDRNALFRPRTGEEPVAKSAHPWLPEQYQQPKSQEQIDKRVRKNSIGDHSSALSSMEEEVQRGVERVLLAILERANSTDQSEKQQPPLDHLLSARSASGDDDSEEEYIVASGDPLATAVESLMRPHHHHDHYDDQDGGSYSIGSQSTGDRLSRPTRRRAQEQLLEHAEAYNADHEQTPYAVGGEGGRHGDDDDDSSAGHSEHEDSPEVDDDSSSAVQSSEHGVPEINVSLETNRISVVDELLADEETDPSLDEESITKAQHHEVSSNGDMGHTATPSKPSQLDPSDFINTPSSMRVERSSPPQSVLSKTGYEVTTIIPTRLDELEADHENDEHVFEDEDNEDDGDGDEDGIPNEDSLVNVLGPLSQEAGGTTGVVLEHGSPPTSPQGSQPITVEESKEEKMTDVLDKSPETSAILESLSNAIDTPASPKLIESFSENFMNYVSTALSHEESPESYARDKYATTSDGNGGEDEDATEQGDTQDHEARELMRTLCAHLLPYGVDKSSTVAEASPLWDESNSNEAGYRIIRLTKSQLRRVEREFEKMLIGVIDKSERSLSSSKHASDNALDKSATNGSATYSDADSGFARDLEEAEKMLENLSTVEKAQLIVEKNRSRQEGTDSDSNESDENSSTSSMESETAGEPTHSVVDTETVTSLAVHPDFPGVRPPGKGEMGDLEYFSLPIIYKSNVTGFEPTKDLYLEPGNIVAGQYLVENELGSAAFSTAYRCIDLNASEESGHQEEVCLKVIKNTKDFFDQSLDEIKILELLRQTGKCHENHIIEMRTFFYHREHLVIVTELLRQNLFEFGKFIMDNDEEPYFTLTRLSYITRQVLVALKFVHDLGLVHSDIKPENILLGSYSRAKVKVIDFGSSCYLTDRQSSYIQSRSYRAPEVVLGLPYDGKIDIWSLGCVVAEMYTGEVTFQNDSIVSMLSRIEAISGAFPRHLIAQGRCSGRFFTKSGLLYERVDNGNPEGDIKPAPSGALDLDNDDEAYGGPSLEPELFDVFQPKKTTLSARLGLDPSLMSMADKTAEEVEESMFVDFVRKLLTIDPDSRPTADEALNHPWIVMSESLTEEDIKYPS